MKTSIVMLCLVLGLALASGPANTPTATKVVNDVDPSARHKAPLEPSSKFMPPPDTAWTFNCEFDSVYNVGVTPVQDSLCWVSAGQATMAIGIYNIADPAHPFRTSFPQTGGPSGWGIRDMAYKASTDEVFAGFDNRTFHVYDATTHIPNNTYTISGYSGTVRGFGYDSAQDSCWTCDFASAPMTKFSITGTNGHQVKPAGEMASAYGIAWDALQNCFWVSMAGVAGASPIWKLDPDYTIADSFLQPGFDMAGGCEMWRDNFLLVLEQGTPDAIWCLKFAPPLDHDVGAELVLAPLGIIVPGPVAPKVRIRNYGTDPQTDIPLTCWIDSAGTNVFTDTITYVDTLAPATTADVTFPNSWTGVNGNTYQVTMFTSLPVDSNYANDTALTSVSVQSAVWETIPKPPSQVDRVVHATVYNPVNDKIYMIGGNPAGDPATYLNLCQEYDPAAGTWTTKAPMTTARGWLPGSFCNGKIYLIGGHDNASAAIAANECYDPVANSWSTKTARPRIGLAASEAVWRDSLIYVLGGNNASSGFANVDIYDPAADAWTVGTALPLDAYMGSAAIIGDTIFMVQAYSGSACWPNLYKGVIDEMDPTQITWTAGPAPTEPIFNGGTAAMDGDVYWLGGFISAATVTDHLWKYSTSTGAITAVTPNYPTTLARVNFMAARPSAQELYVFAGDALGDWSAPNQRYYKISFGPQAVEEQRVKLGVSIDNVMPTFVRDRVRINFTVARRGNVSLGVYDATGSLVRTLVNGTVEPGSQSVTWNRTDNGGRRVASGTYFYRLVVDGKSVSGKAIVLK